MIVNVSTGTPSAGFHRSHNPAKPNTWRSGRVIAKGCLRPGAPRHSKNPVAGTMQRRFSKAALNAGFASTPSARALIIFVPMARFFAQKGTSPHRAIATSRPSPSFVARTMGASCVGAMLKRLRSRSSTVTANV